MAELASYFHETGLRQAAVEISASFAEAHEARAIENFRAKFVRIISCFSAANNRTPLVKEILCELSQALELGMAGDILDFLENYPAPEKNMVNGAVGTLPFRANLQENTLGEVNMELFYRLKSEILEVIADPTSPPCAAV